MSQDNSMSRGSKDRGVLKSLGRALGTPVNAFRTKMPSDAEMGLTRAALCRWANDETAELGSRLRRACGEATLWSAEFDRMNAPDSSLVARFIAKNRSTAAAEWETYRVWLVSAHTRLATGAPGEPVEAGWIARRHRLSTIKPRHV